MKQKITRAIPLAMGAALLATPLYLDFIHARLLALLKDRDLADSVLLASVGLLAILAVATAHLSRRR